ncbi:hypothetical protein Salat_2289600 [Sesamum alatum]|uniref:Uncharacterized protein n=1 Tax=Sesamum alatum TaxID=300844 RepID=A0AAE1XWD3_9LAMI|nr:hypothetical protein Salat_2289600 [Sesamum alatum]
MQERERCERRSFLMYFLCFGVDRLFVYGDLFQVVGMDSKSSLTRVQGVLLVLGPGQALHMCFGIDLSTRVTTNKARGTFLSEGYRCDFSWSEREVPDGGDPLLHEIDYLTKMAVSPRPIQPSFDFAAAANPLPAIQPAEPDMESGIGFLCIDRVQGTGKYRRCLEMIVTPGVTPSKYQIPA